MTANNTPDAIHPMMTGAVRFWERGRILYNSILFMILLLWIVFTWPHFRGAFTLGAFEALVVLALMANLCYSAAYVAELFMQPLLPNHSWPRFRRLLWVLGMLVAIALTNYWIADEIYPAADHPPSPIIGRKSNMRRAPLLAAFAREPALSELRAQRGGVEWVGIFAVLIYVCHSEPARSGGEEPAFRFRIADC